MSRFLAKLLLAALLVFCPATARFTTGDPVGIECVWSASELERVAHVDQLYPDYVNFAFQQPEPTDRVTPHHPGIVRYQRPPPVLPRG